MRLRLRLVERSQGAWRSSPYGGARGSTIVITIPAKLSESGTVADLASFLVQNFESHRLIGVSIANLNISGFFVDGFILPFSEPLSAVIRETDEILVRLERAPALCAEEQGTAASELLRRAEKQAKEASQRAAELEKIAKTSAERAAKLELRVHELSERLEAAERRHTSDKASAVQAETDRTAVLEKEVKHLKKRLIDAEKQLSAPVERMPVGTVEQQTNVLKGSLDRDSTHTCSTGSVAKVHDNFSDVSWRQLASGDDLRAGDTVKYRTLLLDAWQKVSRHSPIRIAVVTKVCPSQNAADGPLLVLRHADGALDCVEVARLQGLCVRERMS